MKMFPQSNSDAVPQEDDKLRGPTTPQGSPFSWGEEAYPDSIWYLYSTPNLSYSQLMIAAQKVESENEETQYHVRVRATVITKAVEGMAKLKHQIAKLKAALTETG